MLQSNDVSKLMDRVSKKVISAPKRQSIEMYLVLTLSGWPKICVTKDIAVAKVLSANDHIGITRFFTSNYVEVQSHRPHHPSFGEYVSGPRILPREETKARMRAVLDDIQQGRFVRDWMAECKAGQPSFKAIRRNNDAHQIEEVGETLRGMMPWIKANQLVDKEKN